jgi:hypothetical protein
MPPSFHLPKTRTVDERLVTPGIIALSAAKSKP